MILQPKNSIKHILSNNIQPKIWVFNILSLFINKLYQIKEKKNNTKHKVWVNRFDLIKNTYTKRKKFFWLKLLSLAVTTKNYIYQFFRILWHFSHKISKGKKILNDTSKLIWRSTKTYILHIYNLILYNRQKFHCTC